jgi:hypothetical protein
MVSTHWTLVYLPSPKEFLGKMDTVPASAPVDHSSKDTRVPAVSEYAECMCA